MNVITIILILIAVIVILSPVVYVLIRDRKSLKKEIIQLSNSLESAKANVTHLAEYIESVQKIKSEEKKISEQIKEAENDEEVYDIISNLIKSNNDKLRNKTKK